MFNKKLIQELPETMIYVYKQVIFKWIASLINIILTFIICILFVQFIENRLYPYNLIFYIIFSIVLLFIRSKVFIKINDHSLKSASLVKAKLRTRLFDHIFKIGMHYQEYVTTAKLVQLANEGINQLEIYFSLYLPQLFFSLLSSLTLFFIFLFFDYKSALILLICVPLIPISIICVQKIAKKLLAKYWDSYTTLGDSFLENLEGLTTLKIYQCDEYKQQLMNQEAENFRKITMRVLIMQLNSISVMDIVAYGCTGLGSYLAIIHYMTSEISLLAAFIVILLSFEFFIPLRQLGSFFHIAMNGIAASQSIFDILDTPIPQQYNNTLEISSYPISFQNLSFCYDNKMILKNISFQVKPNQFIGIVGKSGSGKSTLAKLMMGYYSHYQGEILIQNKQRTNLNDSDFLKHFIYVSHEPMIFKGTVKDNLCFNQEYSDEAMKQALSQVCLFDFFNTQNGLYTQLLEAGSNLSGGQKQRLNIARALLSNGDVYIFDEATSQIDIESESMILSVIQQLAKSKTVIMITHRLSTVKICDQILVMDKGQLVEHGCHQDLMKNEKLYYQLFQQQEKMEAFLQ